MLKCPIKTVTLTSIRGVFQQLSYKIGGFDEQAMPGLKLASYLKIILT
jgi:hypothetical protein